MYLHAAVMRLRTKALIGLFVKLCLMKTAGLTKTQQRIEQLCCLGRGSYKLTKYFFLKITIIKNLKLSILRMVMSCEQNTCGCVPSFHWIIWLSALFLNSRCHETLQKEYQPRSDIFCKQKLVQRHFFPSSPPSSSSSPNPILNLLSWHPVSFQFALTFTRFFFFFFLLTLLQQWSPAGGPVGHIIIRYRKW